MVARRAVPADLSAVETRRLARQLTTSTEAILGAMETFVAAPPGGVSQDAVKHVRSWARDAVRDARRLHQVLT
jgi:hypothetical protein